VVTFGTNIDGDNIVISSYARVVDGNSDVDIVVPNSVPGWLMVIVMLFLTVPVVDIPMVVVLFVTVPVVDIPMVMVLFVTVPVVDIPMIVVYYHYSLV
jgi:hypothetical protein